MRLIGLIMCIVYFRSWSVVQGVPPSPTSIVTDQLQTEFATVKNTIKVLSDQWEKWNTLFVTSLEPRISSTASTLASIDSNIHNLQERAHVWDTFQLHVSAWNEQLASLDRKIDIISKGQEKLIFLDGKMNSILSMEVKIDTTIKIVKNIEETINYVYDKLESKQNKPSHDTLLNEFTTRGVLSTIKMVEKKIDRLLLTNQNNLLKIKGNDKPKLQIKCNTPKIVEELLNDISSKVDIIFDLTSKDKPTIEEYEDEYIEVNEGSGEVANIKQIPPVEKPKGISIKYTHIQKQILNKLDNIANRTWNLEKASNTILNKNLSCENTDVLTKKISNSIDNHTNELMNNLNILLGSYLREERAHIETIVEKNVKRCCDHTTEVKVYPFLTPVPNTTEKITTFQSKTSSEVTDVDVLLHKDTSVDDYQEIVQPTWTPIHNKNKFSCEDLSYEEASGIYIFENSNISTAKRYCDIQNDGLWTVIQRRDNYSRQNNFNNTWEQYKYGFGDLHRDFWMGNAFLHTLSKHYQLVLKIELEDFENKSAWAEYSNFYVGSEDDDYKLTVGGYSGNASDSFSSHNGSKFSTFDRKNDEAPDCCPCAVSYGGGWWFNKCFESNLNGMYYKKPNDNSYFRGIIWEHWLGNYSLKKTVMKVKSKGRVLTDNVETTEKN